MALTVHDLRMAMADSSFRLRLAKSVRDIITKNGERIDEMRKRELGKSVMGDAHFEPGKHEPAQAGAPEHMEPGDHEQYAMNPPAHPEAQDPIGSGLGVPPGQLSQPATGGDPCVFCHDGACPGNCGGQAAPGRTAPPGINGATMLRLKEQHGEESAFKIAWAAHDKAKKSEKNPGHTGDPTKRQPSPPSKGAKLVPDKVKAPPAGGNGGLSSPKPNPLGKDEVPAAKPPSGKVPGQGKPPTSKPGIVKFAPNPTAPAAPTPKPAPAANGTPGGLGHRAAQGPVPAPLAPKPAPSAPGTKLPPTPFK